MNSYVFSYSSLGLPILAYRFPNKQKPKVLILGGVHGDEIEGVIAARKLVSIFSEQFYQLDITLVPEFNIEGVLFKTRGNANKVDLNRNLPTKDWTSEVTTPRYYPGPAAMSESENHGLVQFVENEKPNFILSLHSWNPMLNINGDCEGEAKVISYLTGYKIEKTIGYATPGCLGTFAGIERSAPTLTYEIERGLHSNEILKVHVPAILEALKWTEKNR